jgi:MFS family permease
MSTPSPHATAAGRWRPSRNVWAIAAVSFLTDASSEIIAPLLPLFLVGSLGASVSMVGVIEGGAEAVAAVLKLASGWWSDRVSRRKPLIVAGYALASLVRPFVAVAQSASQVLAIRLVDRQPALDARAVRHLPASGGVHPPRDDARLLRRGARRGQGRG